MTRRGGLAGLAVGVVLAVGPAALWLAGSPVAGGPPAAAAPAAAASPPAARPDPAAPLPTSPLPTSALPTAAAPPPVRVRVADVGVDAPVVDAGVDERGGMAVPLDVATVGWYRFGVAPGSPAGSAVLAGHVDDRVQGRGALYALRDVAVGTPVEVARADGSVVTYRVTAVEQMAKAALPADRLFARDGPPRLVLITCGGDFDRAAGAYTDNLVVTAG